MAPRGGRKDRPSKDLDPTKFDLVLHFLHGRLRRFLFLKILCSTLYPAEASDPRNPTLSTHPPCRVHPLPLFATPGHGEWSYPDQGGTTVSRPV
jgi:hypothetical protein